MIYETAVVVRPDAGDDVLAKLKANIKDAITSTNGELLVEDDWGVKTFAQPMEGGKTQGRYVYFMYKSNGQGNTEIERRYRISEEVMRFIVVNLGTDAEAEKIKKDYKNPNSRSADADRGRFDAEKEKKLFAKRSSCWFSAKKTQPDWKDPNTYSWLVNEFGKISPARVTGLRPKFQRSATRAIKQARTMGLISFLSGQIAR
ncbi:MAG: 30S ribosomal protein S18 [Bacteriovoracaceae bacterium]|nr:30S ribosomal protein S18 [Bacteriovoracaceae bacterium]